MKLRSAKINFFVFLGLIIIGFSFFSFAQENSQSNNNIFLDTDQDGLSNDEEKTYDTDPNKADTDGDGYSDGTEIKGGYDPLKPAPGDKIASTDIETPIITKVATSTINNTAPEEENLTQNLSSQVTNLISAKIAENKEVTMEDLDEIIGNISNQEVSFENLPPVDESEIKIKKQNYSKLSDTEKTAREKEDSIAYLTAVAYVLVNNSPQKISTMDDLSNLIDQYTSQTTVIVSDMSKVSQLDDIAQKGSEALAQIKEVEVPKNLLETHKKGLQLANYAFSIQKNLKNKASNEDPVAQIINLGEIQGILSLLTNYTNDVSSQLESMNITTIPLELL